MKLLIEFASYFLIILGGIPLYLGIQNNDSYFISHAILILAVPVVILLVVKRRKDNNGEKHNAN